jgi:hypothetical protein
MTGGCRPAVIVLGMHRSGTSAVAGTAVRLGFAAPLTPLPASSDNPNGFYESRPIVTINHRIFLAAGSAWNLCLHFEPDWIDHGLLPADRLAIEATLRREFPPDSGFVMKDPRLCLTLPAWLPALRTAGAEVSVLLVLRHPEEVVHSLARRNQLPAHETAPLWLHHMLEAERMTRGLNRAFVLYDALISDWRLCMDEAGRSAGIAWPRRRDETDRDIDDFLSGSMRHHVAAPISAAVGPPPVCDMIDAVWIALRRLADDPGMPAALACLDHVRARFAAWRHETYPPGFHVVFREA